MLARNAAGIDTIINLFHIGVKQSIILTRKQLPVGLRQQSMSVMTEAVCRFTEYRDIKNESLLADDGESLLEDLARSTKLLKMK